MSEPRKPHLLFVDDEPLVLEGLRRLLRPQRQEWDMFFVESGVAALELLEQEPVDMVIADMRMPGMTGAELLNEVMKRHPQMVRLIFCGQDDLPEVIRCVGATHQYLSKPCDLDLLRATVRRASALQASLQSESLRRLVGLMHRLPTPPALYLEMLEVLQRREVDLTDIGAVVARDQAVTAQTLRLVNSAFFGLHREIANPVEAVIYLGVDTMKALVLSAHLHADFRGLRVDGLSLDTLAGHGLQTAIAARAIAAEEAANGRFEEEAFCGGLLHDAGKLMLAYNFGHRYAKALELVGTKGMTLLAAEEETFGANHADIGGYLLGLWGLPVPIVEAIALHHAPSRANTDQLTSAAVVHVANALVLESAGGGAAFFAGLDKDWLASTGLQDRWERWREVVRHVLLPGC